ncbi:MAG: PspA/IM30 family protein [Meiothermus sp.]|uniref:PspA/IM30 family protein n=1 Tax=Meiothermus sp. TaxID=1955249 RepID=UPI0025CD587C|nr:PspA/IM30 family protein [Meiothermus sp.]MCS7058166.1 PspA/IM30 family protein [Meiothermus sp.]MCS7193319.1 PspA/IM30 family protein [Meiothermus sp.]MCX7740872.1 PspA/IM30 family protein [Meiothermus sp.]MDW8091213.1 PspA/IM30 family protein [Meiothermus sp.]MDW8482001.1 PspA/IM30 family protein [Meiothermus sp.]
MGILERLSRLIRANINDLIRRAENPEKIIEQALEDMRATLREARMEVAEAMAELKKLEREQQSYAEQAAAWERKAAEALKAEREDLAREALKRKQQAQALAEGFAQQVAQQQDLVQRLTTQLKALESKIQESEAKKALLIARKKGLEAAEAVRRFESKIDAHSAVEAFEDMEQRIQAMEDKHAALLEMDKSEIERELERLGSNRQVEEDLARLKRELGIA